METTQHICRDAENSIYQDYANPHSTSRLWLKRTISVISLKHIIFGPSIPQNDKTITTHKKYTYVDTACSTNWVYDDFTVPRTPLAEIKRGMCAPLMVTILFKVVGSGSMKQMLFTFT